MKSIKKKIVLLITLAVIISLLPINAVHTFAASKPGKVTITSATGGNTSASVCWKKVKGASTYQVLLDGSCKAQTCATSCAMDNLEGDKTYIVQVRAGKKFTKKVRYYYNKSTGQWQKKKPAKKIRGKSKYVKTSYYKYGKMSSSKRVYVTKKIQNVSVKGAFSAEVGNSFTLNASAKTGMSYTSKDSAIASIDSTGTVTCNAAGTTKIIINAVESQYYRAASKEVVINVTAPAIPDGPEVTALRAANINNVNVTWKAVNGVDGYVLFRGSEKIYEGTNLYYVDTNTTKSEYSIKCYRTESGKKKYGKAGNSCSVGLPLGTPQITGKSENYKHLTINWNKVSNATAYEIYHGTSAEELQDKIDNEEAEYITRNTKYVFCGESISGEYQYYKVRAIRDSDGCKMCSDFSDICKVYVSEKSGIEIGDGYVRICWSDLMKNGKEISAENYDLDSDYTFDDGVWSNGLTTYPCTYNVYKYSKIIVSNTEDTSYIDYDVDSYDYVNYAVVACIDGKEVGSYTVGNCTYKTYREFFSTSYADNDMNSVNSAQDIDSSELNEVENFKINGQTTDSLSMTWDPVAYVDGYRIYRDGEKIYEGINPSFTEENLSCNTKYTYTLKTFSENTESSGVTINGKTKHKYLAPSGSKNGIGFDYHEDWFLDYNINGDDSKNVRIVIGQVFNNSVNNKLNGGSGAVEPLLTRKNGFNPNFTGKDYDLEVYCYDTEDFDNFLLLYVSENVIVGWRTTAVFFGSVDGIELERGVTKSFVNENHLNNGFAGGFVLDPGLAKGARMGSVLSEGLTSYTITQRNMDWENEERLAEYTINGLRVAIGYEPMKHSDKIYGDGKTYGSKAFAITMAANKTVTHNTETLTEGPLAGQTFSERMKPLDTYYAKDSRKVYINGEVATTAQSGEFAATAWFNSWAHRGLIMNQYGVEFAVAGYNGYWGTAILAKR